MSAPKILAAMNAVQSALSSEGISKANRNSQQGYNFRGIDDCYNAVSRLFAENKILPVPSYTDIVQEERASSKGNAIFVTRLKGTFEFTSTEDGSVVKAGPFPGEAMDTADKSTNKAMSASFKYALMQVFTIPTVGDNDADATTHEPTPRPARQITVNDPRTPRTTEGEQQKSALVDPAPATSSATVGKRGPSDGHPLMLQLEAALDKYGVKRADYEVKTAEAMGVGSIYHIPIGVLPQALLKVLNHQKEAKAAHAAKAAGAAKKPPTKKKVDLPPPDNTGAPEMQTPDGAADDQDFPA